MRLREKDIDEYLDLIESFRDGRPVAEVEWRRAVRAVLKHREGSWQQRGSMSDIILSMIDDYGVNAVAMRIRARAKERAAS